MRLHKHQNKNSEKITLGTRLMFRLIICVEVRILQNKIFLLQIANYRIEAYKQANSIYQILKLKHWG